jgi:hypothetical protein
MQVHESPPSLEAEWLEEHVVHETERACWRQSRRERAERDQCERGRADGCFHVEWMVGEGRGTQPNETLTQMRHRSVGWGLHDHDTSVPPHRRERACITGEPSATAAILPEFRTSRINPIVALNPT